MAVQCLRRQFRNKRMLEYSDEGACLCKYYHWKSKEAVWVQYTKQLGTRNRMFQEHKQNRKRRSLPTFVFFGIQPPSPRECDRKVMRHKTIPLPCVVSVRVCESGLVWPQGKERSGLRPAGICYCTTSVFVWPESARTLMIYSTTNR